ETTRFALSSSKARSARCLGPPTGTAVPSTRTASGPRILNSRRRAAIRLRRVSSSNAAPTRRRDRPGTRLGLRWDLAEGGSRRALHGQVLLARRDGERPPPRIDPCAARQRRAARSRLPRNALPPRRRGRPLPLRRLLSRGREEVERACRHAV